MPTFTLEALPAHKGDCLLLHYGTDEHPRLVLIDGGPGGTYDPHLRPRLLELREERGLPEGTPLWIELIMVSHVDDDHINGILDLAGELRQARELDRPEILEIGTLWHNAFDDIIGNDEIGQAATAVFGAASNDQQVSEALAGIGHDEAKILAGINQGRTLRNEARFLDWSLNSGHGTILSVGSDTREPLPLEGGLSFQLVGPRLTEIEKLQKKHDKFLRDNNLGRNGAEAALAAFSDRSAQNLSSLVVLARFEGRTMLLTGDARGDKLLEGLEEQDLIEDGGVLTVDVLKMMHHGSDRNTTRGFFERVRAQHYVFCGDGEHGNPERACLKMLFDARPEGGFDLYFTYPIDVIDAERRKEAEKDAERGKRGPWIQDHEALSTFLAQKTAEGVPFRVHVPSADGASVRIDLLDDLD